MNHDFRVKSRRLRALLLVCACGLMLLQAGTFPARAAGGSRRSPGALVQTTWPMYGFDPQHTNVNPSEHVLNPGNVSRLTLGWSTHVGSPGQVVESSPAIVDGMIYINDADRYLDAFDAATHALKWQYVIGNIQGLHSPAVANGLVYLGATINSNDTALYALNAQTGALVWHSVALMPFNQNGATMYYGAPVVVNGLVYISADPSNAPEGGSLDAVNAQTGAVVWSDALHLNPDQYPPVASVAVANGVLYVSSQYGTLYEIDAQTGQRLWRFAATPVSLFVCAPVVANGVVYVSNSGYPSRRAIFALDAQTGKLLWSSARGVRYGISSVVVVNGALYAAPWYSNYLYAFHLPGKRAG